MTGSTLSVVVAIALIATARTAGAESAHPIVVSVHVLNQAEIPHGVLTHALAEATRIYRGIGVDLMWTENVASECQFRLKIVAQPFGAGRVIDRHSLGAAPGTEHARGSLAYVFYDPIDRLAQASGTSTSIILGHVIAHELGHLLLPHDSHTMVGVMGTGWDRAQIQGAKAGELTFTTAQGKTIRRRLENEP